MDKGRDSLIRMAAFEWLAEQVRIHGDVLPRRTLAEGFEYQGVRVPLLGPQGIFKPRVLSRLPLSITTTPKGPYDDSFGRDELLRYRYRGTNPEHPDNVGLREAMATRTPLVYFHGLVPGKYLVAWPVFIVADDPQGLAFSVAVDDARFVSAGFDGVKGVAELDTKARRAYVTSIVRQRVHQRSFRERVLRAYREQCSLCRLRHEELLDAAHIIPDKDPDGEPVVSNGLALCKLHHAAFDRNFLAIRPDYKVEVRSDILEEEDGPMLLHGLKGIHGQTIVVPHSPGLRPNPESLARRYQAFLEGPSTIA